MNERASDEREEGHLHEADATEADAGRPDAQDEAEGDPRDSAPSELHALRAELQDAREKYLRLAAELDNVRKRSEREVENAHKYGIERFAQALLPVVDSFEAALSADNLDLEGLLEGQRATLRLIHQAFSDAGIEQIDPRGEPFDPQMHEAMSMLAAPAAEPDSVLDVVQKGYSLHSRLLRPARVIVAKAPEDTGR